MKKCSMPKEKQEEKKKTGTAGQKTSTNPAAVMQNQSRRDHSDILGSYTGTPADGGEPEQDADDL